MSCERPKFGKPYGIEYYTNSGDVVRMHRKGQRVRWFNCEGEQVGPEQKNVAPAVAYALFQGWRYNR